MGGWFRRGELFFIKGGPEQGADIVYAETDGHESQGDRREGRYVCRVAPAQGMMKPVIGSLVGADYGFDTSFEMETLLII